MQRELHVTKFQLDEIVSTYNIQVEVMRHYLNMNNGEVVRVPIYNKNKDDKELAKIIKDGLNEHYFLIPHITSSEGSSDIYDFTETVSNPELKDKLSNVLKGSRNVFRKYNDLLLADFDESQRYYTFVQESNRNRVLKWLESIDIKLIVD
ncbi:UPF0158 family protein [Paenibacillus pini]